MELTTDELRENYARFSDEKLIQIATLKASELSPEVIEILKDELYKRNLSPTYLTGIEAQRKAYTEEEKQFYYTLIEKLPCPLCASTDTALNIALISNVSSFVLISSYNEKTWIACESCLQTKLNNATTSTILLGWWSPVGFFRTIQALLSNNQQKTYIRSPLFEQMIARNIGLIEMHKDNPAMLRQIVQQFNKND